MTEKLFTYVAVPIEHGLPSKKGWYFTSYGDTMEQCFGNYQYFDGFEFVPNIDGVPVSHWLRPIAAPVQPVKEQEGMLESFGELIRTLSRLSNIWQHAFIDEDIKRLNRAKKIFSAINKGGNHTKIVQSSDKPLHHDQVLKIASDAWDACHAHIEEFQEYRYGRHGGYQHPDKETYLNKLT